MSKCLKCLMNHGAELNCQFVGETTEATPVAPEVTIVNVAGIVDAFGRLVTTLTAAQNATLTTRVNILGADYVRAQEQAAVTAVTAAVMAVAEAAAPYVKRIAECEMAVVEARTRNEIKVLDLQAQRLDAEIRGSAARPAAQAAHRRPRRHR